MSMRAHAGTLPVHGGYKKAGADLSNSLGLFGKLSTGKVIVASANDENVFAIVNASGEGAVDDPVQIAVGHVTMKCGEAVVTAPFPIKAGTGGKFELADASGDKVVGIVLELAALNADAECFIFGAAVLVIPA